MEDVKYLSLHCLVFKQTFRNDFAMWGREGSLSFASITDFRFLFLSVLFLNSLGKGFAFVERSLLHFLCKMLPCWGGRLCG